MEEKSTGCEEARYKVCKKGEKRCRLGHCSHHMTTMCVYNCRVAASECEVLVDKQCEKSEEEPEKEENPEPDTEPYVDENGCYWVYERKFFGGQKLFKKCPTDSPDRKPVCM